MTQRTFYMVSSIIMDGAEDRKNLEDARTEAKKQAILLSKHKKYGGGSKDNWVTIDKFNTINHIDILLERWNWNGERFIHKTINKVLK